MTFPKQTLMAAFVGLFATTAAALAQPAPAEPAHSSPRKPNVLLILADDLGWSDLGCYGGEIRTPNLDSLAQNGLRFERFYNSSRCSPSRASILTGREPHAAGYPLLDGQFTPGTVMLGEALRPAGYKTLMVGKWHLGRKSGPIERGFDEFYGMLGGFNTCWRENPSYTRWPRSRTKRTYDDNDFYATDAFADYALDFLKLARDERKPWMMYLAFNAPHFPLHAHESDIAKYEELYYMGWDKIREQRFERLKRLGLWPEDAAMSARAVIPENKFNNQTGWANKIVPAWESLPEDRKRDLARRMAVYAAMVDRMDQAIGRVLDDLRAANELDNTVIFFLSDNGACAEWDPWGFDKNSGPNNVLHTGDDLKKVGTEESYVSYGSGWANASNTPLSLFKHYAAEGGIRTPLIVHWPAGLKTGPGTITKSPGHVVDFLPTILEIAGVPYPAITARGEPSEPIAGQSLLPVLTNGSVTERVICIEHEGNRAVLRGKWKLSASNKEPWHLYNVIADPAETQDLASEQGDLVRDLEALHADWSVRNNVPPPPATKR